MLVIVTVCSSGAFVYPSVAEPKSRVVGLAEILYVLANTVTSEVVVLLPSLVVTVILAVPSLTAVTTPLFTVATLGLSLLHVTSLLVALLGFTVAVRVLVSPSISLNSV